MNTRILLLVVFAVLALSAGCANEPAESTEPAGAPSADVELPEVAEGQLAPDFTVPSTTGEEVTLSDLRGQTVVLYFYPKDDTPGCTKQACSFRDTNADLLAAGAQVYGVSLDSIESHLAFKEKYELNFPLLADESGTVASLYGVLGEYQPPEGEAIPIAKRNTFLIDEDGVVRKIWREVDVTTHGEDVLAAVKSLS